MNTISYKTVSANKATVKKEWLVVDADGQILGRLATRVATLIRGKHKPSFTPHVDCGDNVVVINSDKVRLTGKKMTEKVYIRHTGYPGGQRTTTPKEVMRRSSTRLIEGAVRGMLPKSRLGKSIFKNLFVYEGAEHPHEGQQPKEI
ncbi:MAG: 50S ribosomal protein L13 [Bacteroidetes bacterium]|nr:50S ribosomal protein L13 [Bacteroidota bacterium]MDA1119324.1 50S ribosomal protein L13 [Bacteroidota bacterium]